MIEAAPDMKRESEKEWYFGNADKERSGPYGFHEVCVLEKLFMKVLTFFMHPFAHKSFKTMIWMTVTNSKVSAIQFLH